jgi:hypothetical protein
VAQKVRRPGVTTTLRQQPPMLPQTPGQLRMLLAASAADAASAAAPAADAACRIRCRCHLSRQPLPRLRTPLLLPMLLTAMRYIAGLSVHLSGRFSMFVLSTREWGGIRNRFQLLR